MVNLMTGILMKNCCKVNLETGPSIVILQENKELSKTGISRITTILGVNKQTKKLTHPEVLTNINFLQFQVTKYKLH